MDAHRAPVADGGSDYGSEIGPDDADALLELVSQADTAPVFEVDDIEYDYSPRGAHLPRRLGPQKWNPQYPYSEVSTSVSNQRTARVEEVAGNSHAHQSRIQTLPSSTYL
jgi:hypothetical protein